MKYLGLNILKEILKDDKAMMPKFKDYILDCFNSPDPSIKIRALEIITVTTIKENLVSIVG